MSALIGHNCGTDSDLTQNLKATQRIKRARGASRRQYPPRIFSSVVSSGLWVKMPRGFLVKRSKRASSASYKVRAQEKEPSTEDLPTQTPNASVPDVLEPITESWTSDVSSKHLLEDSGGVVGESIDYAQSYFSHPEQSASSPRNSTDSYSPIKPISTELLDRCLSSPAMAESFPLATPVSSIERLLMNHSDMKFGTPVPSSVPTYPAFHQCVKRAFMDSERKSKPPKKPKVIRKLNFEDEVTTSPVLGLKIKKESPETKLAPQSGRKKPLGEFICQLCKEEYPDPFSLAQHKCSRIVRVEYRCPECDKVFSCPANLASHRRWHKPRNLSTGDAKKSPLEARNHEKTSVEGKENASKLRLNNQHQLSPDSSQQHRSAPDSNMMHRGSQDTPMDQRFTSSEKCFEMRIGSADSSRLFDHCPEEPDRSSTPYLPSSSPEEVFECHYCSKKFRRQAYLRKHLAAHETIKASSYAHIESGQITFPCHLCGAHFPSAEIRDKHRLWHAVRDDLLLRPDLSPGEQQIYSCKHCPSTFFSSPGLTRHINKTHPTENRQVMLLQMAVRPGC
ncbi:insulinoma-associated protein 2 [Onychostoma macrolepis]|uniref:insulinoma-associated protein 2 n=1 Tax=Onychostoma macrolepis TaxID=369639 RepID=UPI002729D75C|nr:insulinoma-associated protein 2 [Onychostoma macrolepis]